MGRPQKKKPNVPKTPRCTRTTRSSFLRDSSHPVASRGNVDTSQAVSISSSNSSDPGTLVMGPFLNLLKCHICTEFMTPPVRLCLGGHSTCGKCRKKMFRCGDCREPFSSARNYLIEDILNSCSVQCQFESAGSCCTQIIKLSDFATHANSCVYNPDPLPPQIEPSTGEGERQDQQNTTEAEISFFHHASRTNSNITDFPIVESVYGSSSNISIMTSASSFSTESGDAANARALDDYQRDPFATTTSNSVDYSTSPPTSLMEIEQVLRMMDCPHPPLTSRTEGSYWRGNSFQDPLRFRNGEVLSSSGLHQVENRVVNRAFRTSRYPLSATEPNPRGEPYTDSFSPPEQWPWPVTGHGAAVASRAVNDGTWDIISPEIVLDSSDLNESSMYGPRIPVTVTEAEAFETGIVLTYRSTQFENYAQNETVPFFDDDNEEVTVSTREDPLLIDLVSSDEEE